jgi:glutamyl endopeptidase
MSDELPVKGVEHLKDVVAFAPGVDVRAPHQPSTSVGAPPLLRNQPAAAPALGARLESVPGYSRAGLRIRRLRRPEGLEIGGDGGELHLPDAAVGEFGTDETIIEGDDRTRRTPVNVPPWRFICALRINFGASRYVGTGWFIGPHTVMTAGHCVYMHGKGYASSIEVIPALDATSKPYGSVTSTDFRTVEGWRNDANPNFDYGAIILPTNVGDQTGFFTFAAPPDSYLASAVSNIAGYPADKGASTMWYHARTITSVSPTRLYYDIDTYGGQSGSPVWLQLPTGRLAVGIHTNGGTTFNSGTRITQAIFDNMVLWKQ